MLPVGVCLGAVVWRGARRARWAGQSEWGGSGRFPAAAALGARSPHVPLSSPPPPVHPSLLYLQEGQCFAAAAALDTHKALVHIFFAQRSTKKIKGGWVAVVCVCVVCVCGGGWVGAGAWWGVWWGVAALTTISWL